MKKHLLIFLPALCLLASVEARGAVVELDLEKLTQRSSHIFCGEVVGIKSEWGEFLGLGRAMITEVRIKVSELWKDTRIQPREIVRRAATPGSPARVEEITISFLGGRIGERWQKCADSPTFSPGEKVLVFASEFNGALWTTGWFQGKYSLGRKRAELGEPTSGKPAPNELPPSEPTGKLLVRGSKHLPVKMPVKVETLRLMVRKILLEKRPPAGKSTESGSVER